MGPRYEIEPLKEKYTEARRAGLRWVVLIRGTGIKRHYCHTAGELEARHIALALNQHHTRSTT